MPTNTIDLGDEGLSPGDDISPYLDDHWNSGNEVLIPEGDYDLLNGSSFSFSGSDSILYGKGRVQLFTDPNDDPNPFIQCTGQTVRIENVTLRNNPTLAGFDIDVESDGSLEFINFNAPDGCHDNGNRMFPTFLNRGDANGTAIWRNCTLKDWAENCIYTGQSDNCHSVIEHCELWRNNIDNIRVGGLNDVVRHNMIIMDAPPPEARDGGQSGRGIRVRYDGDVDIHDNFFEWTADASTLLVIHDDNDTGTIDIVDNELYSDTDLPADRHAGSNSTITGSDNTLTGSNTGYDNIPSSIWSCEAGSSCERKLQVSTDGTANVENGGGTLNGKLQYLGEASSVDVFFQYRQVGSSTWQQTPTQTLSTTGTFTETVSGLAGETKYEYRAQASASDGDTNFGATSTWITGPSTGGQSFSESVSSTIGIVDKFAGVGGSDSRSIKSDLGINAEAKVAFFPGGGGASAGQVGEFQLGSPQLGGGSGTVASKSEVLEEVSGSIEEISSEGGVRSLKQVISKVFKLRKN